MQAALASLTALLDPAGEPTGGGGTTALPPLDWEGNPPPGGQPSTRSGAPSAVISAVPVAMTLANSETAVPEAAITRAAAGEKSDLPVDRAVRVSAENLNRLMGLAGESLVEANWLPPFTDSLLKLKARQAELARILERLQDMLPQAAITPQVSEQLSLARQTASDCRQLLGDRQLVSQPSCHGRCADYYALH